MFDDVTDFRNFYHTPLGRLVAAAIRPHIRSFWREPSSLETAFLGYGLPFVDKGQKTVGLMQARRGAAVWPASGPVRSCLVDPRSLPVPDVQLDRLLLVHALEFEADPGDLLDECWRVLDGAGRLLVVVPNRRSIWVRRENNPLGHGQPYSGRQLRRLLEQHGFAPRSSRSTIFIPPVSNRLILRFAPAVERAGAIWWSALGGVLVVEAEKRLYAPSGSRQVQRRRTSARPVLVGQARDTLSRSRVK
jgi:SAM-dependent methyltransferase